ncbi:unnamed protein product [Rhizoctonia solani]|uniref:F-box domain-containing protein n=1 Tax=Rhizoctonia solani TaxID=456999 RepID=A0A8H3GSY2_9AGAM|nr:unnamed protein product [Rhizoctonia solani]
MSSLVSLHDIQQWEDVGQQLENTAVAYLDSCSKLELFGVQHFEPGHLISRIDQRLDSFEALVTRKLNLARLSMSFLRNKLASSIHRLPDEILSRIFEFAVDFYDVEVSQHLSFQHRTQIIYRNLHALLGVCTAWRRVGLSHRILWSLVPIVRNRNDRFMPTAAQLSIERAAGTKLHLVAELNGKRHDMETYVRDTLARFGPRFSTINLHSDSMPSIRVAVNKLVGSVRNKTGSLSGLSLCHHRPDKFMPRGIDDIYVQSEQGELNRLLEPLQVLRLCGLKIHFGGLSFRNLTELRLQDMWAGRTVDVEDFLWSLSSSSQLRRLEIISIFHHRNQANTTPHSYGFPITLPALELLYLEDLYKDSLDLILGSIAPGSHHTTLHLTGKCIRTYPPHDNEVLGFHDSKLRDFKIDTLMIGHNLGSHEAALRPLLEMVPTVTTLYLDCLTLTPPGLQPIINHAGTDNKAGAHCFPRLNKLYIGQSYFPHISGFHTLKEVVASHPIKELGLGVGLSEHTVDGNILLHHIQDPHEELDSFREWFLKNVPKVVWLPGGDSSKPYAFEFQSESALLEALRKWEQLGEQLEKNITAYSESCATLPLLTLSYSPDATELISRIDHRLKLFDDLTRRLDSARSSLARARNKVTSPILRLPNEILFRIFDVAISTVDIETPNHLSANNQVNLRYHFLHALLRVCSAWRGVIVSHGTLWSLVPVVRQKNERYMSTAAQLSLARSTGCSLRLVAELFSRRLDMSRYVLNVLSHHGPRFSSVNLCADWIPLIRQVVHALIQIETIPGSLDSLSMYFHCATPRQLPSLDILPPNDPDEAAFNQMLGSLRFFKLRGINIDFTGVSFKSLVQLRLQDVRFQDGIKVEKFFLALSASSQLRILEIISTSTYIFVNLSTQSHGLPIALPSLRLLYLEDLYQDMLNLVLASIEAGSYRISLHLTSKCFQISHNGVASGVGFHLLRLQDSRIETLILGPQFIEIPRGGVRALLLLMPSLTSLSIDAQPLNPDFLDQIRRPTDPDSTFPRLTELYITRSTAPVTDLNLLKDAVASHPIKALGLGMSINELEDDESEYHNLQHYDKLDEVRSWFSGAVPRLVWLPDAFSHKPPGTEFESDIWQL